MSNEIEDIERCICGRYPSFETQSPGQNYARYSLKHECYGDDGFPECEADEEEITELEDMIGTSLSDCVESWNEFVKNQKEKLIWKKLHETKEFQAAQKAFIRYRECITPEWYGNLMLVDDGEEANKLLEKFFNISEEKTDETS